LWGLDRRRAAILHMMDSEVAESII
jgi:hypothetical protein